MLAEPKAWRSRRAWFRLLLQDHGSLQGVQGFTLLILGGLLCDLEKGMAVALVLHRQETLGALAHLLDQLTEAVASRSPEIEVVVGGVQMQDDQTIDWVGLGRGTTDLHLRE